MTRKNNDFLCPTNVNTCKYQMLGIVYIPIAAQSYTQGVAYYSLRPKIVDVLALDTRIKEK
jgi:hypothetical protein